MEKVSHFDPEASQLREVYRLLEAHTPLELLRLYSVEDQKLMKTGRWDYDDSELITNKIKEILESVPPNTLTPDEQMWRQEILWFWYHHAISCAIWKYHDKEKARWYASMALEYQSHDHPNKITRLLALLVNGSLKEAQEWGKEIYEEPEKTTARELLDEYQEHPFF